MRAGIDRPSVPLSKCHAVLRAGECTWWCEPSAAIGSASSRAATDKQRPRPKTGLVEAGRMHRLSERASGALAMPILIGTSPRVQPFLRVGSLLDLSFSQQL